MRGRRLAYSLVALSALLVVVVAAPAVEGRTSGGGCPNPSFIGQVDDVGISFQYPNGRDAAHITAGTYPVTIRDLSTAQNFHLRDLTWGGTHVDRQTSIAQTSSECWLVTFEATAQQNGDYEYKSDANPDIFRGLVTAHPPVTPPPPPPPPPSPAGPPPPPPPPPQQPDLIATVGPDQRIAVFFGDGTAVTRLAPGTYTIQVHDLSTMHNFHLTGPGINMSTPVAEIVHPIWTLTFRAGRYTFKCDVHSTTMKGSFVVATGSPAPPSRCHVPNVLGKRLADARRALRAAHCSGGSVRYMRSKRARGRVVRQAPRAGKLLPRGARVNLVVSRGRG